MIEPIEPSSLAEVATAPVRRPPWYARPIVIAAAALVLGAALGFMLRQSPEVPKPIRHLSLPTHGIRDANNPTISPDGEYIAFAGTDTSAQSETLFIYETATGRMHGFTGRVTEPDWMSFSPDGRWLLFSTPSGLVRLLVPDGQPILISPKYETATWESDESLIIAWETVRRISASGGEQDTLARVDSLKGHTGLYAPRMIGDTQNILVTAQRADGNWDLVRVDLATGKYETLVERAAAGHYVPTGHLLYMRDLEGAQDSGPLAIRRFDVKTMSFSGAPVPIPVGEQEWYHFGFGLDGTLIYTDFTERSSGSQILWVDMDGRELETLPLESARYDIPVISPDGTRLAVERFNESEQQWDIYVYDLQDGTPLRLSFSGRSENPEWAPDGQSIYYDGTRDGKQVLIKKAADGSGTEEVIATEQAPAVGPVVSPDGKTVLYYASGEGGMDLYALDLQTSSTSLAAGGDDWQTDPWFSPDGRFFVYETQETGSGQIYVRQLGGDAFWEISEGSGAFGDPMWSPDGEYIYFENNGRRLMRVRVTTEPTFRRLGRPEIVAEFDTDIDFALHPDGSRILILSNQMGGVEVNNGLQVVQNWFEEVKRMAPGGK